MAIPYAEVIGDPIAHSKSPLIHRFWLEKMGLEGDFRAVRVEAGGLAEYLAARRNDPDWRGCNVTIPHKSRIIRLLDVVEDQDVGAVNCVVPDDGTLFGENTDIAGVREALEDGVDRGAPACLIGAGGGARAAVVALQRIGIKELRILVRDPAKGRQMLDGFDFEGAVYRFDQADEALDDVAGVINATPLGLAGFPPMSESVLHALHAARRGAFALDMVYGSAKTPFVEFAEQAGMRARDGLVMLVGQARQAFRQFFDANVPSEHDEELRRILEP